MKASWRIGLAVVAAAASAGTFAVLWPRAHEAGTLLLAQDNPAQLSDIQLGSALRNNQAVIAQGVSQALDSHDADLAKSFTDLAKDRNIALPPDVAGRVDAAVTDENSTASTVKRFATGLVTGEADDVASLSGTVAGDLFVFGDIRDVVREGKRLAMGEDADRLVLGLASLGLAVTAATYVSAGGTVPVRAGLTMVKDARKVGRLGAGLTEWAGRSARGVVDAPMLQQAVATASIARPGQTITAMKAAFKAEKAGTKGALDVLRIADGPKDVARAARLAESKGSQTRAIVKILGRGALLLTAGAFNLAWWVFAALLSLFGFIVSIKATTERLTLSWIQRSKLRRTQCDLVAAQAQLSAQAT
jgi:hypothetical protein